jgi:predicted CXXCH cytochrome family protein
MSLTPMRSNTMPMRVRRVGKALLFAACLPASLAASGRPSDVVGSKHDLSVSGGSSVKATSETQPCVFCHTPHNASPAIQLWNRPASSATYGTYGSSTFKSGTSAGTFNTMPGRSAPQPSGSSRLCLSCHDGTIALGATLNNSTLAMSNGTFVPATANIGTDLSNDHPVSFARAGTNIEVADPPPADAVALETGTSYVQCVSCHDAHSERGGDAVAAKFLVKSNARSAICTTCHTRGGTGWSWASSVHATSAKSYTASNTGGVVGLGAHTGYTTIADNACESCHRSHSAPQAQRLLKAVNQRDVCFQCHGAAPVAAKNLSTVFAKTYRHPLESSTTTILHDAAEAQSSPTNFSGGRRHVDCSDCHNPHAAAGSLHTAGTNVIAAGGMLSGVTGVEPASYPAPS